eukprot:TRINITY_DN2653_c0_g1_i3.p1 TRINITY_DN2653_c0_g1~~TRINITY_DN2653_c0_g1_i3.p1  ORF type:complete len:607 (+),score=145.22 TRINITY_DN2653_c0_g1_i3:76-1896(+)
MCIRDSNAEYGDFSSAHMVPILVVFGLLAHACVGAPVDGSVVMMQESMEPGGRCAEADLAASSWSKCADGSAKSGRVAALENGIFSLDGCKAALMVNCYPKTGLYASYNKYEDACGWYSECDLEDLKLKTSSWRTDQAELKSDAMAIVVNAEDQIMGSQLDVMVCGTTCVCTDENSCSGECRYACSSHQAIRPVIRSKSAGTAALLVTGEIQNPLKVCFRMSKGAGNWVWQDVQAVKGLNKFEIGAAPGQNVLNAMFQHARSCRTLSQPCFVNDGPCPSPAVPAGYQPGVLAQYVQLDVNCALPGASVFDFSTPNLRRLEATPAALDKLPFVRLAPAAAEVSFAAQWSGSIKIEAGGKYQFQAQATGVVSLWVAGKQLVQNSGCLSDAAKGGEVDLAAKTTVALLVRYAHKGAGAALQLSYKGPDTDNKKATIPKEAFWHQPLGNAVQETVSLTVVGKGTPPLVQVCGTRSQNGECAHDASCGELCTTSTPLPSGARVDTMRALTVSIPRGSPADHVQMVTRVCFQFGSGTHRQAGYVWDSVTVEDQLGKDGTPFKIKPSKHGVAQPHGVVGTESRRCWDGTFEDTSNMPYAVADTHEPGNTDEEE